MISTVLKKTREKKTKNSFFFDKKKKIVLFSRKRIVSLYAQDILNQAFGCRIIIDGPTFVTFIRF